MFCKTASVKISFQESCAILVLSLVKDLFYTVFLLQYLSVFRSLVLFCKNLTKPLPIKEKREVYMMFYYHFNTFKIILPNSLLVFALVSLFLVTIGKSHTKLGLQSILRKYLLINQ